MTHLNARTITAGKWLRVIMHSMYELKRMEVHRSSQKSERDNTCLIVGMTSGHSIAVMRMRANSLEIFARSASLNSASMKNCEA